MREETRLSLLFWALLGEKLLEWLLVLTYWLDSLIVSACGNFLRINAVMGGHAWGYFLQSMTLRSL